MDSDAINTTVTQLSAQAKRVGGTYLTTTYVTDALLAMKRLGYDLPGFAAKHLDGSTDAPADEVTATHIVKLIAGLQDLKRPFYTNYYTEASRRLEPKVRDTLDQYLKELAALNTLIPQSKALPDVANHTSGTATHGVQPLRQLNKASIPYAAAMEYRASQIATLCEIGHFQPERRDQRLAAATETITKTALAQAHSA